MFVTVIALKYALLLSQRHFLKLTDSFLSSPFNTTHYVVLGLYTQNGDRIIDSVTSLTSPCVYIG